ncbi:MAG: class I SAM-dependent methyltransferase family protein [Candidatus Heimdallarchaeota archaeon]|nr:class I SAM-dependent methyltransferase family protein [Candidatus Heimdallarchaeota archaeon]
MSAIEESRKKQLVNAFRRIIPDELLQFIPQRWWIVGEILIISIPKELDNYAKEIGTIMLQHEKKRVRTILGKFGPTEGMIRIPDFKFLAGNPNTETIHKELGCFFKLDVAKLTFSPGNHGERERLLKITQENEIIVDMFACVGNLSLPLAVHRKPKQVIAAEINPVAYNYLAENIKLNKVENRMKAILGDNRIVLKEFEGQANRVLLGYLESNFDQIRQGIRLCKEDAIIHYHQAAVKKEEIKDISINRLVEAAKLEEREIKIQTIKKVKKYSPGVEHLVFDVEIF